jgi:WD40 repeat protein
VLALAWAGQGARIAAAFDAPGGAHAWIIDAGTREKTADISLTGLNGVACLALSSDGSSLAASAGDRRLFYAIAGDWNTIRPNKEHGHNIRELAFSPSDRRLAIGDENGNITLRAVRGPNDPAEEGEVGPVDRPLMTLAGHDAAITRLEFARYKYADEEVDVLVSGDDRGKALVHLTGGAELPVDVSAPRAEPGGQIAP